jgi:FkbM family methyltransferase
VFGIANRLDRILKLAASPQARRLWRRGIDLETFRRYNLRWLRDRSIKSLIDVGANCGQFSLVMHEVLPEARIVAFEPLADCFLELKQRLAHVGTLVARNVAVGDRPGAIEFHRSSYSQSSSVRPMADAHRESFPESAGSRSVSVECVTLDTALAGLGLEPEIMVKLDVQGFEDKVIAGGLQTIRRASVVWIETSFVELYQGQPLFSDIHDRLRELGFRYHGSHAQLPSPRDDSILQADSIFVRDGVRASA